MQQTFKVNSKKDTKKLARKISNKLKKGDVIALYGELGAGKTFFTQALCKYLDVDENVSSPSYVLMNQYAGKFAINHLDLFRLSATEEVWELGLPDLFEEGITIIEWASLAEDILPQNTIKVKFSLKDDHRIVKVETTWKLLKI